MGVTCRGDGIEHAECDLRKPHELSLCTRFSVCICGVGICGECVSMC